MANDIATLRTRLAEDLMDPTMSYWSTTYLASILTEAINELWPRFGRQLATESQIIAAVDDQSWYTVPTGMVEVHRVEVIDSDGQMIDELAPGTWDIHGTRIQINPTFAISGYTFRLVGLAKYDATVNLIPDELVPLVLARARAKAWQRALSDRLNFRQWATQNQIQNVSINEMIGMIRVGMAEFEDLYNRLPRARRRPVPGRV